MESVDVRLDLGSKAYGPSRTFGVSSYDLGSRVSLALFFVRGLRF